MEKNIYQRLNAVMTKVKYIQKDAAVNNYKAVTHDNVVSKIREFFVEQGIIVFPELIEGGIVKEVPTKSGSTMFLYEGKYDINYINMDNPEDRTCVTVSAHALDNGDKGPGKCVTYATKSAHLKILNLETGENEESRNYENLPYTDHQKDEFDKLLENKDALGLVGFSFTVGPDVMEALVQTFEKGKVSAGKKLVRDLSAEGHKALDEYARQITEGFMTEDQAVFELVDEMTSAEKVLVSKRLDKQVIEFLKNGRAE